MVVASPSNPRDVLYEECLGILMESKFPISFEELVKSACSRINQIERYIGKSFKLQDNIKLRAVLDMLRNHSRVKEVKMKPVVLEYMHDGPMVKATSQAYDTYDVYDTPQNTHAKNLGSERQENNPENIAEMSDPVSYSSYTSYSDGNGKLFKCYYCEKNGNIFQTINEIDYLKHGVKRHPNKPMFPNNAAIVENDLKPQGKEWEV